MCSCEAKRPLAHSQQLGKKEKCQASSKSSKASCKEHFKLLRQLSPNARRCMLDELTEAQRRALERWILRQKAKDVARRRVQSARWQARESAKSSGLGIQRHRRAGRVAYRAGVNIGPIRLHSKYYSDMAKANESLEALLRIQKKVRQELVHFKQLGAGSPKCSRLEAAFRSALHSLPSHQIAAELRFLIQIPAKRWVGRALATPSYSAFGEGLNRGLKAWHRLAAARRIRSLGETCYTLLRHDAALEAVWHQLRSEYFDICVEAGQSPRRVSAKLMRWEGLRSMRPLKEKLHERLALRSNVKDYSGWHVLCKDNKPDLEQFGDKDLIASVACERILTSAPERNAKCVRGDSEGSMRVAEAQKAQLHSLDVLV